MPFVALSLCLIWSFCAKQLGSVCSSRDASVLRHFCSLPGTPRFLCKPSQISSFAQPLTTLLYVKLIVQYQVASVSTTDVYWWCSHTAKVNDPLIGAKEHIYSQMACSNSGNDAQKDHLSSWRICKSLIWQKCYWRACDELLTWVFSIKHCVESVTSRGDPGVRGSVGQAAFSAFMRFGGEPGSRGLFFYSHIREVHSSWTEADRLTPNPPAEDQVNAHLSISVVLGISRGYFPPTFLCWTGIDIYQVPGAAEGIYSIPGRRFCILSLCSLLQAGTWWLQLPCQSQATPSKKHEFHPLQL